jgi:hypothetical protein
MVLPYRSQQTKERSKTPTSEWAEKKIMRQINKGQEKLKISYSY